MPATLAVDKEKDQDQMHPITITEARLPASAEEADALYQRMLKDLYGPDAKPADFATPCQP